MHLENLKYKEMVPLGTPRTYILPQDALTLKAPITTAADDKFSDIFPNFRKK